MSRRLLFSSQNSQEARHAEISSTQDSDFCWTERIKQSAGARSRQAMLKKKQEEIKKKKRGNTK
jgi:hypothetical protein